MYTAVPAHNSNVNALLNHEMGHFFGLNEGAVCRRAIQAKVDFDAQ